MSERVVLVFGTDAGTSVISDYDDGVIGKKFIDFIGCGKMSFEHGMEKFWAVIGALTKTPNGAKSISGSSRLLMIILNYSFTNSVGHIPVSRLNVLEK